jgi:hypothetical protein
MKAPTIDSWIKMIGGTNATAKIQQSGRINLCLEIGWMEWNKFLKEVDIMYNFTSVL